MSKIKEIRAEIRLIQIRRQEIVAELDQSKYLKEYIALMRREVEALNEIQKEQMREAIITYAWEDNRALEKLKKEVFRDESCQ